MKDTKGTTATKAIKAGLYYQLTEDVGPIPKGIYRLLDYDEETESVSFEAGKKVVFGIIGDVRRKIRGLVQHRAELRRTPQSRFLDRYYELLDEQRGTPFSPFKPFTMCFVDPTVARELQ